MEPFPKFILSWALTVHSLATVVGMAAQRRKEKQLVKKLHRSSFPNPLQLADIKSREQK